MRKAIISSGLLLIAALSFTNCVKEPVALEKSEDLIENPVVKEGTPFEIIAKPVDTKTTLDGLAVKWAGGDAMNIYHAVAGEDTYISDGEFSIAAEDVDAGRFTGTLAEDPVSGTYDWYAFYPYVASKDSPASTTKGWTAIGSTASGTQTQAGYDSKAHLAGSNYPLYGKAAGVAYNAVPNFSINHLAAYIEINVTNNSGTNLTINSLDFTSPQDIVGTYYINFADPSNIIYKSSGAAYVSKTASLEVTGATALADGESAKFYIGIRPMDIEASAGSTKDLKIAVNSYEKTLTLKSNVSFTAGKIKKINFNYDYDPSKNVDATFDFTNSTEFSSASISAPSSGNGVDLNGTTITKSDIGLSFAKGTASTDVRWWNASGTLELRTYVGNKLSFTAPAGFNIVKIELSSSHTYTANTGTFSSDTWTGEASEVTLTRGGSGTHKVSSITVKCEKAAVVPAIVSTSIDEAVQGGVGLTKNITLSNYDSAPSLTATPDGTIVTAASVGSITTTGATVTYTLAPNYAASSKEGTITIDDGAGHSGTITVNQPAAVFSISRTSLTLGAASGSTATITIRSDYDWTVVDDLISGFTVSPASFTYSGTQAQTVTITATAANATTSPVDLGIFTFKRAGDNAETDNITISQASAKLAAPTITLTPDAENKKFTVSWTTVANASKYEYYVLDGSAEYKVAVTQTADASTTSFEVTDINLDEEYTVSVKAIGDNNPWVDSDEADDTITVTATSTSEEITGTFTFSDSKLSLTTASGITIVQEKVSGSTAVNSDYKTATNLRVYVGHSLTFSGKTITKIEFTHTNGYKGSDGISANTGTYSQGTTLSTWEGEASNIVITNSGGETTRQLRPTKIVVYYK